LSARPAEAAPPIRTRGIVRENRPEGSYWRLTLSVADFTRFAPGQFVMLSPGAELAAPRTDPLLPRPMAVYQARAAEGAGCEVEVLYKVTGRGTALLSSARPPEAVAVVGPLGRGFPLPPPGTRGLVVGGGTGIASLYELAARASARGDVRVLLGARSARDLEIARDFAALPLRLRLATEDGSRGRTGLVTELLAEELATSDPLLVYACGPTPMMRRAAEMAAAAGQGCLVSLENPMACGFGVCLGCAAPLREGGFALVCRDGPVFEAARVEWENLA
jgi:dihydroorotate dehydrogenase electron transfer subunit